MIYKQTVFVLGAGASMPYGFPSGDGLIDDIVQMTSKRDAIPVTFDMARLNPNEVHRFGLDLADSDMPSIDSFLEHRPEFLDIGKLSIALALAGREADHEVSRAYRKDSNNAARGPWYDYLWRAMLAPKDKFGDNKAAFVTFNYDRSLERYFALRIKAQHGYERLTDFLEDLYRIRFLHIYGTLGDHRFIAYSYGEKRSHNELIKMAEGLRIIHDDPSGNPNFAAAIELIRSAERVCFLGYGFHKLNNDGLDLAKIATDDALRKKQQWFASRFRMTDVEFRRNTDGFFQRFVDRTGQTKGRVGDESDGALEVLRKLPVI